MGQDHAAAAVAFAAKRVESLTIEVKCSVRKLELEWVESLTLWKRLLCR